MTKKNVEDYLTEGMYGIRRPKEAERMYFLGTLRERIVLALTKGQVMTDNCLVELEKEMKIHKDAKLLINGNVSYRFLKAEKELANKYHIPYTVITNEETETDIGAVLTYDYAIDKEDIYVREEEIDDTEANTKRKTSLFDKIKNWFKP